MRLPQVIDSDVASTGKLWYHMQYTDGKPQPLKILSDNADCATQVSTWSLTSLLFAVQQWRFASLLG